ncbi:hypothetical protein KQX54_017439 [Cotesia glomerata]|uniref:Uncharacterized protein n=1 Tax=Cotesia glomerata TaxID=32391 RepID=A0AAV7J8P7_COTGL|nr:hypothetical protein KQX54_017439 [Cotesia glomerata]
MLRVFVLNSELFAASRIIQDDILHALLILVELLPITNAEIAKKKKVDEKIQENQENDESKRGKGKGKKRVEIERIAKR